MHDVSCQEIQWTPEIIRIPIKGAAECPDDEPMNNSSMVRLIGWLATVPVFLCQCTSPLLLQARFAIPDKTSRARLADSLMPPLDTCRHGHTLCACSLLDDFQIYRYRYLVLRTSLSTSSRSATSVTYATSEQTLPPFPCAYASIRSRRIRSKIG